MKRRRFIKNTAIVTAGCCVGASLFQRCTTVKYVDYEKKEDKLVVKIADFGEEKRVIIKATELSGPVYIRKAEEGVYIALSLVCTHRGCIVDPAGNVFVCPCHGAEFDQNGKVLSAPAEKPLPQFKTTTDNKNIYIILQTSL